MKSKNSTQIKNLHMQSFLGLNGSNINFAGLADLHTLSTFPGVLGTVKPTSVPVLVLAALCRFKSQFFAPGTSQTELTVSVTKSLYPTYFCVALFVICRLDRSQERGIVSVRQTL